MKRITLITSFVFLVAYCFSQTKSVEILQGTWYCTSQTKLQLDVNESVSFTKQSCDSLYYKWTFGKEMDLTRSIAMLTPDKKDIIKYTSKPGEWSYNHAGNELTTSVDNESNKFKILKIDQENLSLKRIE